MPPTLSPEERLTLATYDQNARHWADEDYHRDLWAEDLKAFQHYLPAGRVVEIGAGSGVDAERLVAAGYNYLGTDISAAQVAEARRLHPNATFEQRSVYDLGLPPHSFDGFWAAAVLLHVQRAKIGLALQGIRRVIKPSGIGFISVKEGQGEAVTQEPASKGAVYTRLFSFYGQQEFRDILAENNFETLSLTTYRLRADVNWLKFIVRAG